MGVSAVTLWPFWKALATPGEGYAFMVRDMMVPFAMPLNDLNSGNAGGAPRAIPQDALLAVFLPPLSTVWVVAAMVLFCGVTGMIYSAKWAHRVVGAGLPAQMLVSLFVMWNPFTIERMLQGQWSVVVAMWLLPGIAYAARYRQLGPLLFFLGCAAFTPTGWLLGGIIALVSVRSKQWAGIVALAQVMLAAPWVLLTLFSSASVAADSASAAIFAARAETWVGTLGALMGLGGIWNAEAVPGSRGGVAAVCGVALCLLMLVGLAARRGSANLVKHMPALMAVTGLAIIVPFLLSTGPGVSVMGLALDTIPGSGLLRDTQKFVALAVPGMVLLLARAVTLIGEGLASEKKNHNLRIGLASVAAGVLVILTVPALPAEMSPLQPQRLSPEWRQIHNAVSHSPHTSILLLPPGNYRMHGDMPVVDPALKILPGHPIDPGFLIVNNRVLDGNPADIALLQKTMAGEDQLAQNSVGWVLVDRNSIAPGTDTSAVDKLLSKYKLVVKGNGLELYDVVEAEGNHYDGSTLPLFVGIALYWIVIGLGFCLCVWKLSQRSLHKTSQQHAAGPAPTDDL